MSDATRETLDRLLAERILLLDGATGTMIQRHTLTEEDFRGELPRGPPGPAEGQQRPPDADAAGHRDGHPPRLPRGGRGHRRDQHVQLHHGRAGRLRDRPPGPRAQPRGRPPGARRVRRVDGAGRPTSRASWPARSARPTGCCRSPPTWRTRRSARSPSRSCAPPTPSRWRPWWRAAPTCSWWRRSPTRSTRRPRSSPSRRWRRRPGRRLPLMISVTITDRSGRTLTGPDDRGVLDHDRPRAPVQRRRQLRARRGRDAAVHGRPVAGRHVLDPLLSQRRPAERLRRVRRGPRGDGGRAARVRRRAAWSTSWAAAAAPPRTTSAQIAAAAEGRPPRAPAAPDRADPPGRAWSRWPSARQPTS